MEIIRLHITVVKVVRSLERWDYFLQKRQRSAIKVFLEPVSVYRNIVPSWLKRQVGGPGTISTHSIEAGDEINAAGFHSKHQRTAMSHAEATLYAIPLADGLDCRSQLCFQFRANVCHAESPVD
jgi:hypothetical protein